MIEKIGKALRNPRRAWEHVRWRANQVLVRDPKLRFGNYDYPALYRAIAELTGSTRSRAEEAYAELARDGILEELERRIRERVDLDPYLRHLDKYGVEKFVRLDRTMLYALTRLHKPQTVIETGTRWGLGSYFIHAALEQNGEGMLYSFDVGLEDSRDAYPWPPNQDRLGFLLPETSDRYEIVVGDSLETLPDILVSVDGVDLFYHDSLHTYDHMLGEYRTVFPRMNEAGIFASEDTQMNDAWEDFDGRDQLAREQLWHSHEGLLENREVRAGVVEESPEDEA